jgi:tetratricopeptide (TPR) repeat protein
MLADDDAPKDARLVSLLLKFDTSVIAEESDLNTQMLNAVPGDVPNQRERMRCFRAELGPEARLDKASEYKTLANKRFGAGHNRVAIAGYMAGLYMLRTADRVLSCPMMVASHLLGMDDVVGFLTGCALPSEAVVAADATTGPLRAALLLNLAAAALKISELYVARAACEAVLVFEAENAKALFRIAKAYDGLSEVADALGACQKLLMLEPANAEAQKLLEVLRKRNKKEGKMFKGFLERAQQDNEQEDGLVTAAEVDKNHWESFDRKMEKMRRAAMALSHQPHFEKTYRVPVALANDTLRHKLNKMADKEGEDSIEDRVKLAVDEGADAEGALPIPPPQMMETLWRDAAGLSKTAPMPMSGFMPGL